MSGQRGRTGVIITGVVALWVGLVLIPVSFFGVLGSIHEECGGQYKCKDITNGGHWYMSSWATVFFYIGVVAVIVVIAGFVTLIVGLCTQRVTPSHAAARVG